MGKLLDLKFEIDHRLLALVNVYRSIKAKKMSVVQKTALRRTNERFKGADKGACLICGNGPSLNELEFSAFGSTPCFVANYFYKHPDAEKISPSYYVIIDGKVMNGIWPISMIDEIFKVFPQTTLFLDVRWMESEIMDPYRDDERIYWVLPIIFPNAVLKPRRQLDKGVCGLNVVATAISMATAMGYTKLGIAGVDGDGLFREITNMESHFYNGEKDHSMRNFESMVKSLMLSTENLWAWLGIVKTHRAAGIHLQNLCRGGIMDCMPRVSPTEFLLAAK